jgi:hypothetical protein
VSVPSTLILITFLAGSAIAANTIDRDHFNFGHQSGYLYSRTDSAYFKKSPGWAFETGLLGYYTPRMPLVENPDYYRYGSLKVPLTFNFYPCDRIALEFNLTDAFVNYPYNNQHDWGGASPRFKTKIKLCDELRFFPATALTMGVTWSSAKPTTIWAAKNNYQESNGLAGPGTGETDYLILLTFSKRFLSSFCGHARIGLAPLGSPVPRYIDSTGSSNGGSYSAQADEIPYGLTIDAQLNPRWMLAAEIAGMYNGLRTTVLAHYSVFRVNLVYRQNNQQTVIDAERGLTNCTDTWVLGFYHSFEFLRAMR